MITFYPQQLWNEDRDSLVVFAFDGDRKIRCAIPMEALTDPFVEFPTEARARMLFHGRQAEFEERLRQLIQEGRFNEEGDIVLYSSAVKV